MTAGSNPEKSTVVKVMRPTTRYDLWQHDDGRFAATQDGALVFTDQADDRALWKGEISLAGDVHLTSQQLEHLHVRRGPHSRPAELLRDFAQQGWICLPDILDPQDLDGLQQVACVGAYSDRSTALRFETLRHHAAVARATAEPVSLWLIREYLRTPDIRLAHPPSLAVLEPDDGERAVQGWHTDFPYLWGVGAAAGGSRVPQKACDLPLGVQRNICITDFTHENGATVFKLGSFAANKEPPRSWGWQEDYFQPEYRAEHGLPRGGADTQVIEAPAGSILLYDARNWHRQGINYTGEKRAAMLQAMTPSFVLPFVDTASECKRFLESAVYQALNVRERRELIGLLVHRVMGALGPSAIGIDIELTKQLEQEAFESGGQ